MTGPQGARLLSPPREVQRIAATLVAAGFETWCVGGAVRDALLGHMHGDWDLATAATPAQVRALFPRTVPHGIEYGTVGVLDRNGVMHEVTTFRRDVRHDGRHAVVEFGVSLDEDLARRDFTINAIAYSPATGEVRDPFGGQEDLRRGVIRAVGAAAARMTEDRLRALRALRFAGRFGFEIEPATWTAIAESAPHLTRLSRERVYQEIEKTLKQVRAPSRSFGLWRRSGAFASLIPPLASVPDLAFDAADSIALPDESRRPERAEARLRNRLTTMFLDLPVEDARRTLGDLRASNRDSAWVTHLVGCWHAIGPDLTRAMRAGSLPDGVVRRWIARTGRATFADFCRVAVARLRAERAGVAPGAVARLFRRGCLIAFRDPVSVADLAVDGNDLAEAGIPAGPAVGSTLRRLLDAVIDDPALNQRDTLLQMARAGSSGR